MHTHALEWETTGNEAINFSLRLLLISTIARAYSFTIHTFVHASTLFSCVHNVCSAVVGVENPILGRPSMEQRLARRVNTPCSQSMYIMADLHHTEEG